MPRTTQSLILFAIPFASLIAGCPGVDNPADLPTKPVLPEPSDIPAGTYSGSLEVSVTVEEDGVPATDMQSVSFSIVIDQDGRLLDGEGNPFLIRGTYQSNANPYMSTLFANSITVTSHQIVLRFDLTVAADLGDVSGEFTGTQTDRVIYHPSTGNIEFVRSQEYGGRDSAGTLVTFDIEAHADLSPS
ncbi:MAG TPA: hypothetical protein VJZ71_18530 [Phycisphaerae bacterium]|nr:hypothetical protein [Phycisphaerae bacterium]